MAVKPGQFTSRKPQGAEGTEQPKRESTFQGKGGLGSEFLSSFGVKTDFSGDNEGGLQFEEFFKQSIEIIKEQELTNSKNPIKFQALRLMNGKDRVYYSSILFVAQYGDHAAFHIAMFEGTNKPPAPRHIETKKRSIDLLRTPTVMLTEDYTIRAQKIVARQFGIELDNCLPTDATLIPSDFDYKDESKVKRLVNTLFVPAQTELICFVENFIGTSIKEIRGDRKGNFVVEPYFHDHGNQYFDAAGFPIRRDISLDLSYRLRRSKDDREESQEDRVMMTRTGGYIEQEYFTPEEDDRGRIPTQCFAPNFIITGIEAAGSTPVTEHYAIFGILSTVVLSERQGWKQTYLSRAIGRNKDNADIGLLNVEANLDGEETGQRFGKPYDVKKSDKDSVEERLGRFLNLTVIRNMAISIDIADASPSTWSLSIFRDVADGDEDAKMALYDVIDKMLGFEFDDYGHSVFEDIENDIHGGWYKENGEIYDVRNACAYLPVVKFALAAKDPDIIHAYNDSLHMPHPDSVIRAHDRYNLLRDMCGESLTIKYMHRRLTFNGDWIAALVKQMDQAKFTLDTNFGSYDARAFGETGYSFAQAGVDSRVRITSNRNDDYKYSRDDRNRRRNRRHGGY